MLKAGIVGLPNIGKSSLFKALTAHEIEIANYPFATISPNSGVIEIKDERMDYICGIVKPHKIVNAFIEFVDIAGLVKGASQGAGLGNRFLANIREVDAICHVVRCFESKDILHVENSLDPLRDIEIVNYELIIADIEQIDNRLTRVEKKAIMEKDLEKIEESKVLRKIKKFLELGKKANQMKLSEDEYKMVKSLNLLTIKPTIYIANISEDKINSYEQDENYLMVKKYAKEENAKVVPISAKIEADLSELDETEKQEFLKELNIKESSLNILAKETYSLLGLATFFTVGVKETKAWTFKKGSKANECAGIIHSDFQRGFIRAEIYNFEDFKKYGSESKIKENGKLRNEGKDYVVQDGDIIFFRFNV